MSAEPSVEQHPPQQPTAATTAPASTLCNTYIERLESSYQLEPADPCPVCEHLVGRHRPAPTTAGYPSSASPSASDFANKLSKVAKDLPKWSSTSVCRTFLDKIGLIMPSSGIDKAEWNKALPHLLIEHVAAAKWVQANIVDKNLGWEESSKVFTAHFQLSDHRETLKAEYRLCKQTRGETGQAYVDRVHNLVTQLGYDEDDEQTINKLLDNLRPEMYRSINHFVLTVQEANPAYTIDTFAKASSVIIKVDVMHRGASEPERVPASSAGSGTGKSGDGTKKCKYHPDSTTHSTDECRSRSAKDQAGGGASGGDNRSNAANIKQAEVTCYTCGGKGHKSPACPQNPKNGGPGRLSANTPSNNQWSTPAPSQGDALRRSERVAERATQVKTDAPAARFAEIEDDLDDPSVSLVTVPSVVLDRTPPASVFVPASRDVLMLCRGLAYPVLVDTGATCSFIHSELVKELDIPVVTFDGCVKLASSEATIARIGKTEPLEVTAVFPVPRLGLPAKTFRHSFEVMSLPHEHQFIMGCDLIGVFFPTGVPAEFIRLQPSKKLREPTVRSIDVSDASPLLIDDMAGVGALPANEAPARAQLSTSPDLEQQYASGRARLMADPDVIQALAENDKITGFCNLPESVVHLDIDPLQKDKLFRKQYPIPESVRPQVDAIIQRWHDAGKIRLAPPGCRYNSPLLVVPKKDDEGKLTGIRVCLDVRAINNALIGCDKFQIPKIRDALENLAGSSILGEFDLNEAYLQHRLDDESQVYTAFTWNGRQYMFVGACFGLKNLPSHFQRCMSFALSDFPFTFAYLDNIPFGSKTWDEHRQHALMIIHRMTQMNLRIKPSSVKLGHSQIKCLGHVLSNQGIGIDPEKLDAVRAWSLPRTGDQLASFLGFAQYVRPHVRNFGDLTAPLEAVKIDKEIIWTDALKESFELTKEAILRAPFLRFPDFDRPFYIASDASNSGIGGVLYQPHGGDDGNITSNNIVMICSKVLSKSQRNYPAYKKELCAIVYCLRQFHSFVWGRTDLVIYTDHKPLIYMFSQTELSVALQQWMDVLCDYCFDIRHRPGVLNVMPDALSRMHAARYDGDAWGVPTKMLVINPDGSMSVGDKTIVPLSSIISDPATEPHATVELGSGTSCSAADADATPSDSAGLEPDDSVAQGEEEANASSSSSPSPFDLAVEMEKRGKTVPTSEPDKSELIQKEHDFGHFGREAVFKALWNKGYWWPNMRADISAKLSNCDPCTRYVVTKAGYNPAAFITAAGPWIHVQLDTSVHLPASPDGYTALLVIIDVFTGFVILRPIKTNSAAIVARKLWKLFCTFGVPKIVQSDNGPEFVNEVLRALVRLTGVDHRFISPYNPRADGKVERSIGTVMGIIKKELHGSDTHWPLLVPFAQLSFNNKIASLTNSSPFSLMFGRGLNEIKDYTTESPSTVSVDDWKEHQKKVLSVIFPAVSDRIRIQKQKMIKALDKHRRVLLQDAIPNGAIVMLIDPLRGNKFEPKYIGPYTVVRRARNGAYVLKDGTGDLLDRHVPPDQLKLVSKKPRPSDMVEDVYEVQEILKHRGSPGKYDYYVKWKDHNDRTWEPAASFLDDTVIRNYWKHTASVASRH
jgi:RNase H-like domain found in reverse transcriptase/Integrase core domain/Integrase zinc binding domain/Reverse transcriptase (RNA-dependent DNA polymerase)/Chromo (CHRromatin Organisation MOdifier) domain